MNPNNGPKLKLVKVKAISPGSGGRSKKDTKKNINDNPFNVLSQLNLK